MIIQMALCASERMKADDGQGQVIVKHQVRPQMNNDINGFRNVMGECDSNYPGHPGFPRPINLT
jgi:hypothetical protein